MSSTFDQFALLIPSADHRNGTILILPPPASGEPEVLQNRVEKQGRAIINTQGWQVGWRLTIHPEEVAAPVQASDWHSENKRFGDSLEMIGYEAPQTLVAGQWIRVVSYWRVNAPLNFDVFGYTLVEDNTLRAYVGDDYYLYRWLYPSVFWKLGDVIPQTTLLHLPDDMTRRGYSLAFGLYTQPDHVRLPVFDSNGGSVQDNQVRQESHRVPLPKMITAPPTAIQIQARFGNCDAGKKLDTGMRRDRTKICGEQRWHANVVCIGLPIAAGQGFCGDPIWGSRTT